MMPGSLSYCACRFYWAGTSNPQDAGHRTDGILSLMPLENLNFLGRQLMTEFSLGAAEIAADALLFATGIQRYITAALGAPGIQAWFALEFLGKKQ